METYRNSGRIRRCFRKCTFYARFSQNSPGILWTFAKSTVYSKFTRQTVNIKPLECDETDAHFMKMPLYPFFFSSQGYELLHASIDYLMHTTLPENSPGIAPPRLTRGSNSTRWTFPIRSSHPPPQRLFERHFTTTGKQNAAVAAFGSATSALWLMRSACPAVQFVGCMCG